MPVIVKSFRVKAAKIIVAAFLGLSGPALSGQTPVEAMPPHQAGAGEERDLGARLSAAALERTGYNVVYDPAYVPLAYPGGDVPSDRGVCADVVVRSLRSLGLDLQQLIHEDMRRGFSAYPKIWGLARPDRNIDHRRVPNIEAFLTRKGARLPVSSAPTDYLPGDIVAWNLRGDAGSLPHIGVVTDLVGPSGWPMVVHNIGDGPQHEDVLFSWPMTGRYRLTPEIARSLGAGDAAL